MRISLRMENRKPMRNNIITDLALRGKSKTRGKCKTGQLQISFCPVSRDWCGTLLRVESHIFDTSQMMLSSH